VVGGAGGGSSATGRGQRVTGGLVCCESGWVNGRGDVVGRRGLGRGRSWSRGGRRQAGRASVGLDRSVGVGSGCGGRGCVLRRRPCRDAAAVPGRARSPARGGPFSEVRASLWQRRMPIRAFRSPARCRRSGRACRRWREGPLTSPPPLGRGWGRRRSRRWTRGSASAERIARSMLREAVRVKMIGDRGAAVAKQLTA
jgi:hypothetical protein